MGISILVGGCVTCTMGPRRMNIMVLISVKEDFRSKSKIRNEYPEHASPFRLLRGDVEAGWEAGRMWNRWNEREGRSANFGLHIIWLALLPFRGISLPNVFPPLIAH